MLRFLKDGSLRPVGFGRRLWVKRYLFKEAILKSFIGVLFVSLTLTVPALAEKLVDPTAVAPEYREAAEKRRAEQVRQRDCAHKADIEKVMPRERTTFLLQCLEAADTAAK